MTTLQERDASSLAAVRSGAFNAIFPASIVARERRTPAELTVLFEVELGAATNFASKRAHDFAAGRDCAHEALRAIGARNRTVPRRADGSPQWPHGYVGSITHTDGYYAAVVAVGGRYDAIGIDAERVGRVTSDMWNEIFTVGERRSLDALIPTEQARTAAIMFSAKEAFYKCQHPLTGAWIDFDEVSVDVRYDAAAEGTFRIQFESASTHALFGTHEFSGRFCLQDGLVVTGLFVETGKKSW